MFVEKYDAKTDSYKMVPCNFDSLMKKITNRKFEFEGKTYNLKGFTRYRGYRLSRKNNPTGASAQDMNLDISTGKRQIWTEINSCDMHYKLTTEEYVKFYDELMSRVK